MRKLLVHFVVACTSTAPIAIVRANECTPPSSGPDAVVMDVVGTQYWATVGGVAAYSWGSDILNKGTASLPWSGQVGIAQNAYRLKNNRFEQIGISWVKLAFQSTNNSDYCACVDPGSLAILGVGCSDIYEAWVNGTQSGLGPRSAVNAFAGTVPPVGGTITNALDRRLQLKVSDIDSGLNPGAIYFAELQVVSPPDTNAGNSLNNIASEPRVPVFLPQFGAWGFSPTGPTVPNAAAIFSWKNADPTVIINAAEVPNEGRFYVGSRVSDNGDNTWHYEYAIFNLNSHRSAGSFSVPVPQSITVSNVGFHDIDYHSGEPYDGTDWPSVHENGVLTWSTQNFAVNENANALRWSTLYNFRFDADAPPGSTVATLGLFRPGAPDAVTLAIAGPAVVVPTLSAGGLLLMGGLVAAAGWWVLRKAGRHA